MWNVFPTLKGYYYPYAEWSQEDKDGYSYNPTAAKKLLADASFPSGFKTNIVASTIVDSNFLQLIKAVLLDIGVDTEIKVMDRSAAFAYMLAMKHDQMAYFGYPGTGTPNPLNALYFRSSKPGSINPTACNDVGYDALVAKFEASTSDDEMAQILKEMDKYIIQHYWTIYVLPSPSYTFFQPYLKGFIGDAGTGGGGVGFAMASARWWIDETAK